MLHDYGRILGSVFYVLGSVGLFWAVYKFISRRWLTGITWMFLAGAVVFLANMCFVYRQTHNRDGALYRVVNLTCRNQVENCGYAMLTYAEKHDGDFPKSLEELLAQDQVEKTRFFCPAKGWPKQSSIWKNPARWTDFTFVLGLTTNDPPGAVLCYCTPEYHVPKKAPVFFLSGKTEWVDAAEFVKLTNTPALMCGTTNKSWLKDIQSRARRVGRDSRNKDRP